MSDAKLKQMAEALYPYLRNLMREDQSLSERPKGSAVKKVYIPEIDYMVALYRLRQEVKVARYRMGKLETIKGSIRANQTCYCIEASEALPDGTFVDDVFIPTKTLNRTGDIYGVFARSDYRVQPAQPVYAGGITDIGGDRVKGAASCYPVKLAMPITKEIIENTRDEWRAMTEAELARRLVRRSHMMEVLDILEQGQIDTFRQVEMWRILEVGGEELTSAQAEAMDADDMRRLKPKKIVPTWMGDEI